MLNVSAWLASSKRTRLPEGSAILVVCSALACSGQDAGTANNSLQPGGAGATSTPTAAGTPAGTAGTPNTPGVGGPGLGAGGATDIPAGPGGAPPLAAAGTLNSGGENGMGAGGGPAVGGAPGMDGMGGAAVGGMVGMAGADTGGAGGAGAQCDPSPGMAIQFAEGVIDQLTGNLGADGPSGDGPRTLELWAKFTSINSWTAEQTIIELGRAVSGQNMVWGIDMSGYNAAMGGGYFGPYTNGVSDNNGTTGPFFTAAPDVGWLHLAWAYEGNGGNLVFTVNGVMLPTQLPPAGFALNLTPGIVTLGASQSFGATGWNGIMDEVRVWTVYRTPQEIADNMNVFLTGSEPGLAAYYDFDATDGSVVDDVLQTPSHQLTLCTAMNDRCNAVNNAMPTVVVSDIPGPFTCAP